MLAKLRMGLGRGLELTLHTRPHRLWSSVHGMLRRGLSDGKLPTRSQQLNTLKSEDFDVLVIGGGVMGCGCALESASRGLKTALVEAEDFATGASCKSSKLIEGSNSYLHAAIQGADLQQIYVLQQVLSERATMLGIAPHLNRVQPMLMPIYSPLKLPLYWLGLKLYDAMAGLANVRASHYLSKEGTLNEFPLLRREGLLGALVYYDGQLDDARMCLALALTAIKQGATAINYVRLLGLKSPDEAEDCRTAIVRDELTKLQFRVKSKCVINATGAGTDKVRQLDDSTVNPIAVPRSSMHVSLPSYYGSSNYGLLFPSDESPLVMLPFENRLLVGSMDVSSSETNGRSVEPQNEEVTCLLAQTRQVLDKCVQLRPDQVLSAWKGEKLAIRCPNSRENEDQKDQMVPHFLVEVSGNQMITLAGGRWSTYRVMASDAIDTAIEYCELMPRWSASCTHNLLLDGAEDYNCMLPLDLVQTYDLPMDVAQHLAEAYGSNAYQLLSGNTPCSRRRLHSKFAYIEAEVSYACKREYACNLVDVIARRLRVAFVDAEAAFEMLPVVLDIMAKHRSWKPNEQKLQLVAAQNFLINQMGLGSVVKPKKTLCFQQFGNNESEHEQSESDTHANLALSIDIDPSFKKSKKCTALGLDPRNNEIVLAKNNYTSFILSQADTQISKEAVMKSSDRIEPNNIGFSHDSANPLNGVNSILSQAKDYKNETDTLLGDTRYKITLRRIKDISGHNVEKEVRSTNFIPADPYIFSQTIQSEGSTTDHFVTPFSGIASSPLDTDKKSTLELRTWQHRSKHLEPSPKRAKHPVAVVRFKDVASIDQYCKASRLNCESNHLGRCLQNVGDAVRDEVDNFKRAVSSKPIGTNTPPVGCQTGPSEQRVDEENLDRTEESTDKSEEHTSLNYESFLLLSTTSSAEKADVAEGTSKIGKPTTPK